jgi:dTDP-4-dehydrorhamnose 3,5-epimerase
MRKHETPIEGAYIIEIDRFVDHRGFFVESYNRDKFRELGIMDDFVQDSHSRSHKGVLRGMHFQYPPKAMSKMVRCLKGKIFDVCVDMRKDSPTYKQWHGVELSEENGHLFYIPAGCAHGFYSITDSEMSYKCGETHSKEHDAAFRYDDAEIGIAWPLNAVGELIISDRDRAHPEFSAVVERANVEPLRAAASA